AAPQPGERRQDQDGACDDSLQQRQQATSVTPFAPRALDRALAAVIVGMARLADGALTSNSAAAAADRMRTQLDWTADVIRDRVLGHKAGTTANVAAQVRARAE